MIGYRESPIETVQIRVTFALFVLSSSKNRTITRGKKNRGSGGDPPAALSQIPLCPPYQQGRYLLYADRVFGSQIVKNVVSNGSEQCRKSRYGRTVYLIRERLGDENI